MQRWTPTDANPRAAANHQCPCHLGTWVNRHGTTRKLRTMADVDTFMAANDLQDVSFGHWGRFHSMDDANWQPNFHHEAQQLVPPPPVVPLHASNFIGRRVRNERSLRVARSYPLIM